MALGRYVQRNRTLRRKTQDEFAEFVNVSPRLITALETGERTNYDEATKILIESALGWEFGSFDRVVEGGQPMWKPDLIMARIEATWLRLELGEREAVAMLCENLASH